MVVQFSFIQCGLSSPWFTNDCLYSNQLLKLLLKSTAFTMYGS